MKIHYAHLPHTDAAACSSSFLRRSSCSRRDNGRCPIAPIANACNFCSAIFCEFKNPTQNEMCGHQFKKQSKTNNKSSPSSYAITPIKQSAMIMHVEEIGFIVFLPQSANKWQIFACFLLNFLFLFFQKSNYLHFLFESIEHADTYTILKHTNLNCKWVWVARNLFRVRKIFLLIVLFKRDWNLFGIASILHQNVLARRL